MNISLPESFFYKGKSSYPYSSGYAKVKNGILYIYGNIKFNKLMYALTFFFKGKTCYYCGKKCSKDQITLDHLIPRDFGGPTIPDNLVPACGRCNSKKSNLTREDLMIYRQLSTHNERHNFKKSIYERQERIRHTHGFLLPSEWYDENFSPKEIIVNIVLSSELAGKRDVEIADFYNKYQHFQTPVIVDRNGFLLDGLKTVMFAKNSGIEKVPVIVLENVERLLRDT